MSNDPDKPVTAAELREALDLAIAKMERFVLDREIGMLWKVIALQVTLIAAIAGAQWGAITFMLTHWKP